MTDDNPLVRKLASFAPLTDDDRHLLERVTANPMAVPARTDLIREGDAPRGVYLVMDGLACRYKLLPNGNRQVLAYLLPGDFCDIDVALLDAMDHAIGTLAQSGIVLIPTGTVRDLLDHRPGIARGLRLAALVEAATARQWLASVGRRSCEERLAHLLCELLVRLAAAGRATDGGFELPLTQVDLADATGMTTVHVNRSLRSLRKRKLIDGKGRRIEVLDVAGLRKLAAFDPGYLHRAVAHPTP
ncbi:Crp/Fnr family transcriptional regulator [Methylorubrum sp. SB2]|uniref:Crp/Fnr family transcriptional regulator n=1 Tax=Methylorubrum subtropicum TaxID=3138812 RepID=UPI00313D2210